MRSRFMVMMIGTMAPLALGEPSDRVPQREAALVVHEWGTFRSVVSADGRSFAWHPLEEPSDLPRFVYTLGLKGRLAATVRMETPVLYFHSDREMRVSVDVAFPGGTITEWYPRARGGRSGIRWRDIDLEPQARPDFPVEDRPSHYYPARETAASPLCACGGNGEDERERFLFYRGVGTFELPLSASLEGDGVRVRPRGAAEIRAVVLLEKRDGRLGYAVHERLAGETSMSRPFLGDSEDSLAFDLERILVDEGLYEDEARAMVATWRDSWLGEGLRIVYVVPRTFTDAVLPLRISPRPTGLVRVFVGRMDIATP